MRLIPLLTHQRQSLLVSAHVHTGSTQSTSTPSAEFQNMSVLIPTLSFSFQRRPHIDLQAYVPSLNQSRLGNEARTKSALSLPFTIPAVV